MNPIVSLKGVTVSYQSVVAIENASLSIYQDDFIGIIGPNGGGKTTLIKAILGMIDYSGEVDFAAELFRGSERLVGYLPQQSNFDRAFPISVLEVVMSGLQGEKGFWGRYRVAERQRAMQLLESVGIADVAEKAIGEISGGQMQRALLCRAIISEPKLLILDEPTNFVDNNFEKELYALLRELNKRMAIVMVSHDIGTITSTVKSIVCVNRTVHRHDSNIITQEQLDNYHCPIQIVSHGHVPHTVLAHHDGDGCKCGHHK
ncbi:MAG: ABC transporter ATP-binding protein [Alistipes sp.]|nr:ABC transporter ATP-binding protein [Alistipes sp.]